MEAHQEKLLTVREVGQVLRISTSKVYELTASGELAHYKIGRAAIRIAESHLTEYLQTRRITSKASRPVVKPLKNLFLQ